MKRRDFLKTSSLVAAAGLWGTPSILKAASGPAVAFHPLRRGAGYFTGRGGTIGWIVNDEALAVIDTQFPVTAQACLDGLPARGERLIDVVLNTHHHPDHTSGNGVFRAAAKSIVAQENVPRLQHEAAARSGKNGAKPVVADETFAQSWRRELGDEVVTARYFGAAHTAGDAIIHMERANVVHMGDLVFNRLYPYVDRPAGSDIRNWVTVLENAIKTYPRDAIYLFGHGKEGFGVEGSQDDLGVARDHLNAMLEHVEKGIAAGESRAEIAAMENMTSMPEYHTDTPNRLSSNLGKVYDELMSVAP